MAHRQRVREVAVISLAIAGTAPGESYRPARVVDRAASVGAAVALAGCILLPFVEFRANRIVDGQLLRLWQCAGPWTWVLLASALAAFGAAALPPRFRGTGLLAAAVASFGALLFALGSATLTLMPASDTPARVSVASGAWIVLVGIAMVWFQGNRLARSHRTALVAGFVAGALLLAAWGFGGLSQLSLAIEYRTQADTFWQLVYNHVALSLGATLIAAVIGVPLGIVAARSRVVRSIAVPVVGLIQTIPSLALYGLLVIPLAALGLPTLGTVPALIALTLYALLPIVRNTFLGVSGVDSAVVDAGRGMGMSSGELLLQVEVPLALPLVLEGLRAALVLTIGIAAVMAIAGAQNLGTLIFLGWGSIAVDLVLLGAIPMVVISIIADQGMRLLESVVVSPGIRTDREERLPA